jgi:hypothetical protein
VFGKESHMGTYMGGAMSVAELDDFARSGRATEVADWVIALNLKPHTHVLYMRMCRIARIEDREGIRLTLTREEADNLSRGDGSEALNELLGVGAITKVAAYRSGKVRFQIEIYPPEVRSLMGEYRQAAGMPVVSYT